MPAGDPGPASVSVTDRERRRAEHLAVRQRVEAVLRQRWPAVFCTPRVPLRIGIREDILALAGEDIDPVELSAFLRWWVRRLDYADAVAHGEDRRDLDGNPAGCPDENQIRAAATRVYGPRAAEMLARIGARRSASIEQQKEGKIEAKQGLDHARSENSSKRA